MPAVPLVSIQGPSSACTVGRGTVQKAKWLGGGPARSSVACGEGKASTKSFQTKGINIICGAISLPGAQYGSGLATCSLPKFCAKAWLGLPRHILALNANALKGFPPPTLSPAQALLRLSLSGLDNGWTLTGSGSIQGSDVDRG